MKSLRSLEKFKTLFSKKAGFIKSKGEKVIEQRKKSNPKAVMTGLGANIRKFKVPSRKSRMALTLVEARTLNDLPPGRVKKAFVKGLEDKYYGKRG